MASEHMPGISDGSERQGWRFFPVPGGRAHEAVTEQLAFAIRSGAFRPYDALPSLDQLARLMSVSKPVIIEAVRVLTTIGLVTVTKGRFGGAVVCPPDKHKTLGLKRPELSRASISELLECRRMLEIKIAVLAGQRATVDELDAMQESINNLAQHRHSDRGTRLYHDSLFHYRMAFSAHNFPIALHHHQILEHLYAVLAEKGMEYVHDDADKILCLHQKTLDAIILKVPDKIIEIMSEHLNLLEFATAHHLAD